MVLAGQERFRTLTSAYYRGALGIILVYDVSNKESFDNLKIWLSEIDQFGAGNAVKMLVGNKIDTSNRVIPREVAENFAKSNGLFYTEASAKTNEGVSNIFIDVVQHVSENIDGDRVIFTN